MELIQTMQLLILAANFIITYLFINIKYLTV